MRKWLVGRQVDPDENNEVLQQVQEEEEEEEEEVAGEFVHSCSFRRWWRRFDLQISSWAKARTSHHSKNLTTLIISLLRCIQKKTWMIWSWSLIAVNILNQYYWCMYCQDSPGISSGVCAGLRSKPRFEGLKQNTDQFQRKLQGGDHYYRVCCKTITEEEGVGLVNYILEIHPVGSYTKVCIILMWISAFIPVL